MTETPPTSKIRLGLFFGGRSCEHEISVISASSILKAINRDVYDVSLIAIDKKGRWQLVDDIESVLENGAVRLLDTNQNAVSSANGQCVAMDVHHQGNLTSSTSTLSSSALPMIDVVLPILHGTFGEDGTLQGLFELAGIPYVGCGVAASAVAMDKDLAKKIFTAIGIPQSAYLTITKSDWETTANLICDNVKNQLEYPVFVKPANLGSSVGITKAHNLEQLTSSIELAFQYDNKIVIEQSMENCHEVECSVLGNDDPITSVVGEIIPGAEFYDYQTKYIDDKTDTVIPAMISEKASQSVRELSIKAFKAINGSGLARIDFFVQRGTDNVFINEINTMPGFTPISMYPKMWAKSGIPYSELINRLIELALERSQARERIQHAL